jgi:hypothetical protein
MNASRESSRLAVQCPACGKSEYFVYRRRPSGDGKVRNLCRCRCCDGAFACEEDRVGRVVLVEKGC